MNLHEHFSPDKVSIHTDKRSPNRFLLCNAAAYDLVIEHIGSISAFLHESHKHNKLVLVRQLPRFGGSFSYQGCVKTPSVVSMAPPSARTHITAVCALSALHEYKRTLSHPWLLKKLVMEESKHPSLSKTSGSRCSLQLKGLNSTTT